MKVMRDVLLEAYDDWLNNYASTEIFAEHNGLTEGEAHELLALARKVAGHPHPDA